MSKALLTALCFTLPASADADAVPARITVIPAPDAQGLIIGVDGRTWRMPNPAAVVASQKKAIQIDENHAAKLAAPIGQPSPSFGWIEKMTVEKDGSITAPVDWTERGLNAVRAKDYRFLSPVIEFLVTGEIVGVHSIALTNDPNFLSLALNSAQPTETTPMPAALLEMLKLPPTATEAEVLAAVQALIDGKTAALNAAAQPPLDKFVPRADYDVALNARTTAETALNAERKIKSDAEITALIDGALKAGKITPATVEYHRACCAAQGGVQQFKKFIESAPVVAAEIIRKGDPTGSQTALNAEQISAMSALGVDEAAFRKANSL